MQSQNTEGNIKYPLANAVKKYSDSHPVPEYNNSGWYIGSVGQWEGVMKQLANSNINYANVTAEIGNVINNDYYKWSWMNKFRERISKVGYEYYWPRNNDNSPLTPQNYPYIITSSVKSSGASVTIHANAEGAVDRRWFFYGSRNMGENQYVSYTYPFISF